MTDFHVPIDDLVAATRVAPEDQVEEQSELDTRHDPAGPELPGGISPNAVG